MKDEFCRELGETEDRPALSLSLSLSLALSLPLFPRPFLSLSLRARGWEKIIFPIHHSAEGGGYRQARARKSHSVAFLFASPFCFSRKRETPSFTACVLAHFARARKSLSLSLSFSLFNLMRTIGGGSRVISSDACALVFPHVDALFSPFSRGIVTKGMPHGARAGVAAAMQSAYALIAL